MERDGVQGSVHFVLRSSGVLWLNPEPRSYGIEHFIPWRHLDFLDFFCDFAGLCFCLGHLLDGCAWPQCVQIHIVMVMWRTPLTVSFR
eukprot:s1481_g12.t1